MTLAYYWTVHHIDADLTCGHQHETEEAAQACLDAYEADVFQGEEPEHWCVYECARRLPVPDPLDDCEPCPEDRLPPPRCRFCGDPQHPGRSCTPPATGWNAVLGCYV